MSMPNMMLAENRQADSVTVFYDYASKQYGLRKSEEVVKDGVHIEATKSITMTRDQLRKLLEDAKDFVERERP
jgi:hypothetical protein